MVVSLIRIGFSVSSYNFTTPKLDSEYYSPLSYQELEEEFLTKNRYESYKGNILNYMVGIDLSNSSEIGHLPKEDESAIDMVAFYLEPFCIICDNNNGVSIDSFVELMLTYAMVLLLLDFETRLPLVR